MDIRHLGLIGIGIASGFGLASIDPIIQGTNQKQLTIGDFPDLGKGLMQTPGVLDVKSAIIDGKKQVIFAWFKNKAAVNAWYHSKMHRDAMVKFFPNLPAKPQSLSGFKDENAPLLVVASVTPGSKPVMEGSPLAVDQIAIEIYTPVPGGLAIGGGFGPKNMEVPGLYRLSGKPGESEKLRR